jgi:hypothetical protein
LGVQIRWMTPSARSSTEPFPPSMAIRRTRCPSFGSGPHGSPHQRGLGLVSCALNSFVKC